MVSGLKHKIGEFRKQLKEMLKRQIKEEHVEGLELISKEEFKLVKDKAKQIHFSEVSWDEDEEHAVTIKGLFAENVKSELEKLKVEKEYERAEAERAKQTKQNEELKD